MLAALENLCFLGLACCHAVSYVCELTDLVDPYKLVFGVSYQSPIMSERLVIVIGLFTRIPYVL